MSRWGGGGEGKIISSAPPPTPPTLTGQVSNYDPRWRHRKPDLSSVPLQNNGCTAGYSEVFCFSWCGSLISKLLRLFKTIGGFHVM